MTKWIDPKKETPVPGATVVVKTRYDKKNDYLYFAQLEGNKFGDVYWSLSKTRFKNNKEPVLGTFIAGFDQIHYWKYEEPLDIPISSRFDILDL